MQAHTQQGFGRCSTAVRQRCRFICKSATNHDLDIFPIMLMKCSSILLILFTSISAPGMIDENCNPTNQKKTELSSGGDSFYTIVVYNASGNLVATVFDLGPRCCGLVLRKNVAAKTFYWKTRQKRSTTFFQNWLQRTEEECVFCSNSPILYPQIAARWRQKTHNT
jgi:hypothetical protein